MFSLNFRYLQGIYNAFLLYLSKFRKFFLKFAKPFPIEASFKITENCNSKCLTCNVWKNPPQKDPSLDEIKEIFENLKNGGIKILGLTGGEPLLRGDIIEIVKSAKKTIGKVYIVTNGLLLKKKAEELAKSGVDWISVSIDGIGETNDYLRGIKGYYKKAIEGIKELKKHNPKIPINIGTTIVAQNISQIPQLIKVASELGATWTFNLFDNHLYFFEGVKKEDFLIKNEKIIDRMIGYLYSCRKKFPQVFCYDSPSLEFARDYLKQKKVSFHCSIGFFRVYIDSKFNLYSGCWALPPLGNLKNESLKDVLKKKEYKKRLEQMFNFKCPGCTCGYVESLMIENLPSTLVYLLFNRKFFLNFLK